MDQLLPKSLPKPKVTFNQFSQLIFTFREVTKLAYKVSPRMLILVFVLNSLWGLTSVPGFYIEKLILDKLVESVGSPNLQNVIVGLGVLVGLRLLIEFFRNFLSSVNNLLRRSLSRLFDARLRLLISKKMAELDIATIEDPEFKNKFEKIDRESSRRAWGLMMPLSDIPNYIIGFLSSVGVLIFLHPLIAIGIFLVSLPQILIDSKFIKKDYQLNTELSPQFRIWGWLVYFLMRNKSFMELKILNLSEHLSKQLETVQLDVLGKQNAFAKKRELSSFFGYLPFLLFEFGVSIWLIYLVILQKITIGSFELFLRSLRSAQQNMTGLVSSLLEVYENYVYVTDLVWFLNLKPGMDLHSGVNVPKQNKDFAITFKDVWFRYKDDQSWILKGMNFDIKHGEKIAIVGENGAGKSTLIKLLARFYDPQKGDITVGKNKLSELKLDDWMENLGILFQEFETYPFNVYETVGYGDVERLSEKEDIKSALSKTDMIDFVEDLPEKYKTPLHPELSGGVRPSIGQWQRFGISRMLFRKNAGILIMDEPTSNVDPEAEEKIFKELISHSKDKILIFVTQRFSTVRIADRILVVDKGIVVEDGTHEELMKKDGKYARLFRLQAVGYK